MQAFAGPRRPRRVAAAPRQPTRPAQESRSAPSYPAPRSSSGRRTRSDRRRHPARPVRLPPPSCRAPTCRAPGVRRRAARCSSQRITVLPNGGPAEASTTARIDDRRRRTRLGGNRMNENAKWRVVHIDDVERRGRFVAGREHLGIHSFGMNAVTRGEDGGLINEHDEAGSGQEEVYVVLEGTATFDIDGETFEAPAGTFVSVPPESRRKATGDAIILALGGTPGEAYQALDWGEAWSVQQESMTAYGEQRYADALAAVRSGLKRFPEHAGLNYNSACFAPLGGEIDDETFSRLRRSGERFPPFREQARADDDFAAIRDDPRFEDALR